MSGRYKRRRREIMFHQQQGLCYWCKQPMVLINDPVLVERLTLQKKIPPNMATIEHLYTRRSGVRRKLPPGEPATACACHECNQQRGREESERLNALRKKVC